MTQNLKCRRELIGSLYFLIVSKKSTKLVVRELPSLICRLSPNFKSRYTYELSLITCKTVKLFHLYLSLFQSASNEAVEYLQMLCSNDVDIPEGHISPTGMQNERGGYENECMLVRQSSNW